MWNLRIPETSARWIEVNSILFVYSNLTAYSPLGRVLIKEMNRLGMLVDLSHTADTTAKQALELSEAPVIWSHSSARAVHNVPRNVPDDILKLLGRKDGQKDGVVMVCSHLGLAKWS